MTDLINLAAIFSSSVLCGALGIWTSRNLHMAKQERARAARDLTAARYLNLLSAENSVPRDTKANGTLGVVIAMVEAAGGRILIAPEHFANAINRRIEWSNCPSDGSLIVRTETKN